MDVVTKSESSPLTYFEPFALRAKGRSLDLELQVLPAIFDEQL